MAFSRGGIKKRSVQALTILGALSLKQVLAEEGPSETDVAIAATLIVAISFVMTLYYFTNWQDPDIQKYSWKTVSDTISIFCAVLMFQSFNDIAEATIIDPLFGEGEHTFGAMCVDLAHMLVWFAILQMALAKLSGAFNDDELDKLEESEKKEEHERRETNLACVATLLAHMTGFAAINAFGTVQQRYFSANPFVAFLAVFAGLIGSLVLQRITDRFREWKSMGDDGKKSEWEEMWDDETEEAENDVMGLVVSFTTMNSMRFLISGCLPNQEGKEEEGCPEEYLFNHTFSQKARLLGLALFFTVALFAVVFKLPEWTEDENLEKTSPFWAKVARLIEGLVVALSMCFSWSFFYGTQMILAGLPSMSGEPELLAVLVALVISLGGFFMLIGVDHIKDKDCGASDEKIDKALESIMGSISLTIGFSWEQCFDMSVDNLAVKSNDFDFVLINEHSTKFFLSLFCAGLLVPAWRWYILPYVLRQGWKFGWVLNLPDLMERPDAADAAEFTTTKKKMQNIVEKLADTVREIMDAQPGKERQEAINKVHNLVYQETDALKVPLIQDPAPAGDAPAAPGEVGALRQENQELKVQLETYKKMFDGHMETMTANLTKMNDTMNRIETGLPQ